MRGGLRRRISSWILAVVAFGEPRAETIGQASGRALSLRLNVHATLVTEMQAQQQGNPQGPTTAEDDWNITVERGGKISWNYLPTARTRRGAQTGVKITGTSALDQASRTANSDAMWQFSDGQLTFLRS